jgi:hypothetical protein
MEKINIGISVMAVKDAQLWSSGINQNLAFLVTLLKQSPYIGNVFLLNGGNIDQLPPGLEFSYLDVPLVKPQDVTYVLDVVIEMGAQLPHEWLLRMRALGKKIITFFVGHTYADNAESPIFDSHVGQIFNGTPWTEVWTLPQYIKTCVPMLKTIARVPVVTMPHIWSPHFLESKIREFEQLGHEFGYMPAKAGGARLGWRAAIFEPNISVVKTCFLPMLICDQAYRLEPQSINLMMALNTMHMKEHPTFNRFAIFLDLTKHKKASYEPRVSFVECMAAHKMNAVVSHQWENEQNYLYYDALYGGYPLIHNSDFLQQAGVGIYYHGFQAAEGAKALIQAWKQDPEFWHDYKQRATEFLRTLDPTHPVNVDAFVSRLISTTEVHPS